MLCAGNVWSVRSQVQRLWLPEHLNFEYCISGFLMTVKRCMSPSDDDSAWLAYSSTLKMEEVYSSKTSIHFNEATWRNIPEDDSLHSHHRGNIKTHRCTEWPNSQITYLNCHTIFRTVSQVVSCALNMGDLISNSTLQTVNWPLHHSVCIFIKRLLFFNVLNSLSFNFHSHNSNL
jgi:hypothetical protein